MSKQFKIDWAPEAEELLRKRDRFTRQAIKETFAVDPYKGALPLDGQAYATPVANNRYTVVWQVGADEDSVLVKAVVPTQFQPDSAEKLKEQVREVVALESRGKLKLAL